MRLAATAVGLLACGAGSVHGACGPDLSFITPLVDGYLASRPVIQGAAVIVQVGDEVLYERYFGSYTPATVVPIASATKWLSGAVVMSAVDSGAISLDTRVAEFVPSFDEGLLADITVRQCFSHSSGLPGDSALLNQPGLSLQAFADAAAASGLRTDGAGNEVVPGTDFCYGGASMQVAGAVVENATGEAFESLLQSRIAGPLGMTGTSFPAGAEPRVAGGIRSNARDYARFLRMLLNGGELEGVRVLSEGSVAAMNSAQIGAVTVSCTPPGVPPTFSYGVGTWLDFSAAEGQLLADATSPGAFGFNPWIVEERELLGVFMIQSSNAEVTPLVRQIQAGVLAALAAGGADLDGDSWVGAGDLSALLGSWGPCEGCGADLNGDGVVGAADLSVMLGAWGACE